MAAASMMFSLLGQPVRSDAVFVCQGRQFQVPVADLANHRSDIFLHMLDFFEDGSGRIVMDRFDLADVE